MAPCCSCGEGGMAVPLLLGNDWEAKIRTELLHNAASSSKGAALRTANIRAGFTEFDFT